MAEMPRILLQKNNKPGFVLINAIGKKMNMSGYLIDVVYDSSRDNYPPFPRAKLTGRTTC